ncbi:hypothetical protein M3Y97_00031800 [Aphelenchoides bicaudatus]|nr:hypothetical protein M3Y97_00031800 [Aphelenchoides bicaudatus]
MEADKDEDLMYEDLEDMETTTKEVVRPPSSTGSISESDNEERVIRVQERRHSSSLSGEEETDLRSSRKMLIPRRLNEVPSSHFNIYEPLPRPKVTEDTIDELYENLGVDTSDSQIRTSSLFVQALKPISVYEVEKIFAEFKPTRCALLSEKTAILKFETEMETAEALVGVTKKLVRVRKESAQEDGELNEDYGDESAEETKDGRLKPPRIVLLRKDGSRKRKQLSNTVEIDVDEVEIPAGNWQVIVKHVPKGRHIFVRFARAPEIRQSIIMPYKQEVTENPSESVDDADHFKGYNKQRIKPGINVFREDGTELPWDFEHDTRFYEETGEANEPEKERFESKTEEIVTKSGERIKSRGRGAKKFLLSMLDSDSD